MWKKAFNHIPSNFLKAVFHKIYLVHSWILCLECFLVFLEISDWNIDSKWVNKIIPTFPRTHHKVFIMYQPAGSNFFFASSQWIRKFCKGKSRPILVVHIQVQSNKKIWLTLSWRRPISYSNQSIDLRSKSMEWLLYDIGLRPERVKEYIRVVDLSHMNACGSKKVK